MVHGGPASHRNIGRAAEPLPSQSLSDTCRCSKRHAGARGVAARGVWERGYGMVWGGLGRCVGKQIELHHTHSAEAARGLFLQVTNSQSRQMHQETHRFLRNHAEPYPVAGRTFVEARLLRDRQIAVRAYESPTVGFTSEIVIHNAVPVNHLCRTGSCPWATLGVERPLPRCWLCVCVFFWVKVGQQHAWQDGTYVSSVDCRSMHRCSVSQHASTHAQVCRCTAAHVHV